jgi:hypothetical protein
MLLLVTIFLLDLLGKETTCVLKRVCGVCLGTWMQTKGTNEGADARKTISHTQKFVDAGFSAPTTKLWNKA